MNIHEAARKGFREGSVYEACRPGYTDEVVTMVIEFMRNVNTTSDEDSGIRYDLLELGAGTGKLTRKLQEKLQESERFLATDPLENLLTVLKETSPGVQTEVCVADNIPLPDNSVKAIVCAQCFHWFANAKSLKEISRVLVKDGVLLLVWNRQNRDVAWVQEWISLRESYMGDNPQPQYASIDWDIFKQVESLQHIQEFKLKGIEFGGSIDFLLAIMGSTSYINNLDEKTKTEAFDRARKGLQRHHGNPEYIDLQYYTLLCAYRKIK